MQDLRGYVDHQLALALDKLFSQEPSHSPNFVDALAHVLLAPGKRVRGQLVLHAAICAGLSAGLSAQQAIARATPAAIAVEAIHAYSLVHDDLPCMDNDDLRRGRPTCHVKYGEAMALLVGDALQTMAFAWLAEPSPDPAMQVSPANVVKQVRRLAIASGPLGMVGGQVQDCESVGASLTEEALLLMHGRKTGALLEASLVLGVLAVASVDSLDPRFRGDDGILRGDDGILRGNDQILRGDERLFRKSANPGDDGVLARALIQLGQTIGLVYQIQDDVLDVSADAKQLGKTAGKDALHDKPTAVSLWGLAEARLKLEGWKAQLEQALVAIRHAMPAGEVAEQVWTEFADLIRTILRRNS